MPSCGVLVCRNRSNITNFKTCCVTYHRFPKKADLKEKWIGATGRNDKWFPTQHSVICSSHFEEQFFLPACTRRRLIPNAVPTLKLRFGFVPPSTSSEEAITSKKTIIKPSVKKSILEKYKVRLKKYENAMKVQRLQIRRLQNVNSRLRKKLDVMKNVMKTLKNENLIGEEYMWVVESDGL